MQAIPARVIDICHSLLFEPYPSSLFLSEPQFVMLTAYSATTKAKICMKLMVLILKFIYTVYYQWH